MNIFPFSFYWRVHFLLPLLFVVLATAIIQVLSIDERLASWFFQWEGNQWSLRNAWITSQVLHTGGKYFSLLIALVFLALFVASFFYRRLSHLTAPLGYVVFAAMMSSLLVSIAKSSLAISCPWDFAIYGGHLKYLSLWEQLWERNGSGCFPAGHASAGYTWICLYFFGRYFQSSWRWAGLFFALSLGLVFGVAQQLRGAHFISHDLWTLAICWFFSLCSYEVLFAPKATFIEVSNA